MLEDVKKMCYARGDVMCVDLYYPRSENIKAVHHGYVAYCDLRDKGVLPEDARYVLPNATATMIATTYNVRQWRHVLKMRLDKHSQWEIRDLMRQAVSHLAVVSPVFFGDLVQEDK